MKHALLVALALMTGTASAADSIVGRWKLTDYTMKWMDTGEVTHPRGQDALGYLEYSPNGHMSVIITSNKLPRAAGKTYTDAEAAFIFNNSTAFAGTYKVQGNKYVAHADVSTVPDLLGVDLGRTFEINGDKLTITTNQTSISTSDGRPASITSIW